MKQSLLHAREKIPHLFRREINFKPPLLFLILVLLFAAPYVASAQHTLKNFNNSSDYKVTFRFEGFHTDRCECEETRSLKGYAGGFRNGNAIFFADKLGTEGDLEMILGPGYSRDYYWTAHYDGITHNSGCTCTVAAGLCPKVTCHEYTDFNTGSYPLRVYTQTIKSPRNLTASNGTYDNKVIITWEKGSDIPDQYLDYKVYRDGVLIATVDPESAGLTYTDTNRQPGETHTYQVATFTNNWGNQESVKSSVTGSTFTIGAVASVGEFHNRVKLTWNNVSSKGVEEIKIERSIPGSDAKEELAIVNKSATSYSDYDGIPGYSYTYTVTPLAAGKTFIASSSTGYRSPNGVIKGTIKSKLNAGVPGITVTVRVKTATLTAGASNYGTSSIYTTKTDSAGAYEITGIYYYKEAEFYITPSKNNHVFKPSTLTKKLDLNSPSISAVDFTDETVYTIAGQIKFNNTTCLAKNVEIYLNGKNSGIKTDSDGKYALAVQDEGTYTVTPKFLHHTFAVSGGTGNTRTIAVDGDKLNQDFVDTQTDTLFIQVKTGCMDAMGVATVKITSTDPANCYNQTFKTNASGVLNKILPAQAYNVEVTDLENTNKSNILNAFETLIVDLTQRDTLTQVNVSDTTYTIEPATTITTADGAVITIPADTTGFTVNSDTIKTAVVPAANFIYHGQLTIIVHNLPDPEKNCSPQVMLMERGEKRVVRIEVLETHGTGASMTTCTVDSGMVTIYDVVADKGVSRYRIKNGEVFYTLKAGDPNLATGNQKLFEVFAQVGQRTANRADRINSNRRKTTYRYLYYQNAGIAFNGAARPPGGCQL